MSEIVPNGYTKIDYQKKADWQKNPTREYKWKNSDYVYNNHDYLERKGAGQHDSMVVVFQGKEVEE